MIQSMTGYGKAVVAYNEKKINVEIKSLNSKALDLSTRIAPLYREKEMEIRQYVAKQLDRGKVDFSIWIEKDAAAEASPINADIVKKYFEQIKAISEATGIPEPENWFETLLRLPDVTTKTDVEELSVVFQRFVNKLLRVLRLFLKLTTIRTAWNRNLSIILRNLTSVKRNSVLLIT